MNKRNTKFMRILFISLAISSLTLGILNIVNIKGQAIASLVLLSLLLFVEIINFKRDDVDV